MSKITIIPPERPNLPARRENNMPAADLARVNPGGAITSTLMRWEAQRHARTFQALTARARAEQGLFDAQADVMDAYVRRGQAAQRLVELPEVLEADSARRRAERAEEMRDLLHRQDMARMRREAERAHAERLLVDAQHALKAQREHGYGSHQLGWLKTKCEMLDVELGAAERRALLRDSTEFLAPVIVADGTDEVDRVLLDARNQLRASGLDTAKIDAELDRRSRKR